VLLGRENELERAGRLLLAARDGDSGALVIAGAAGIGKTSLLDEIVAMAEGMRVLRAGGFESESELPFAGLIDLLRPLEPHLEGLRTSQRSALESALGIGPAAGVDPLAVFVAVLELLSAAADERPLLLVVDDFQWLDRPSAAAIAFLCHHLNAEAVALVIGTRDTDGPVIDGVELLLLPGLAGAEAAELARAAGATGAGVAERLAELSAGNPLALIQICGQLTGDQLTGANPMIEPFPAAGWAEQAFGRRIVALDAGSRQALLVAAAAGTEEMRLIVRALAVEGLEPQALEAAELAGLVEISPLRLGFRHPLIRSATYHLAGHANRRAAHAALAAALVEAGRVDERAWHLAAAAVEPDDAVAAMMEDAAGRAAARGGYATAARALERAASLAPEPADQARLLVQGAGAAQRVGGVAAALDLLDRAQPLTASPETSAHGELLRGRIEARTGSTSRAYQFMIAAAEQLEQTDPAAAALALVESVDPCIRSGRPATALETAQRAAEMAGQVEGPAALYAEIATAAALVFTGAAGEASRRAIAAADSVLEAASTADDLQLRAYLGMTLAFADEWPRARGVLTDLVADCQRWAPAMLPYPLVSLGWLERGSGDWAAAVTNLEIAVQRATETGRANDEAWGLSILGWIRAAQGREHRLDRLRELNDELGLPYQALVVDAADGILALGRGDGAAAAGPLRAALERKQRHGYCDASTHPAITPDLVEALLRSERPDEAAGVLAAFEGDADRPWARGQLARAQAMLAADDNRADELFATAQELHAEAGDRFGAARSRLCHGERLRRAGRRKASRSELEAAAETFQELAAASWLDRCRQQVTRSGRRLRPAGADRDELTPAEHQVAGLVCQGLGNRAIGQRLFMSEKTVEAHLTRIYRKLGASSRFQLMQTYRPVE
jgi:DNA-binding CsgD family transcriptional regulator